MILLEFSYYEIKSSNLASLYVTLSWLFCWSCPDTTLIDHPHLYKHCSNIMRCGLLVTEDSSAILSVKLHHKKVNLGCVCTYLLAQDITATFT